MKQCQSLRSFTFDHASCVMSKTMLPNKNKWSLKSDPSSLHRALCSRIYIEGVPYFNVSSNHLLTCSKYGKITKISCRGSNNLEMCLNKSLIFFNSFLSGIITTLPFFKVDWEKYQRKGCLASVSTVYNLLTGLM